MSIKAISLFMVKPLIEFKLKIPIWLLIWIILLPLIAYGDKLLFGRHDFLSYLGVSAVEIFLVYLGFMIAYNTKILEDIYK